MALTNNRGRVTQRYRYTAYGTPTALTADYRPQTSASAYRHLFTGREWLSNVGLQDNRYRYYSPSVGRWLTTDPIGFFGGMHFYAYVSNNCANYRDPIGLDIWDFLGSVRKCKKAYDKAKELNDCLLAVTKIYNECIKQARDFNEQANQSLEERIEAYEREREQVAKCASAQADGVAKCHSSIPGTSM